MTTTRRAKKIQQAAQPGAPTPLQLELERINRDLERIAKEKKELEERVRQEQAEAKRQKAEAEKRALEAASRNLEKSERKRRTRMKWETDDYTWEKMTGFAVCASCIQHGEEACLRICEQQQVLVKGENGEEIVGTPAKYTRCQRCKVKCRKCNEYTVPIPIVIPDDDSDGSDGGRAVVGGKGEAATRRGKKRQRDPTEEIEVAGAAAPSARRVKLERGTPGLIPEVVISARPTAVPHASGSQMSIAGKGGCERGASCSVRVSGLEKTIRKVAKTQDLILGALSRMEGKGKGKFRSYSLFGDEDELESD